MAWGAPPDLDRRLEVALDGDHDLPSVARTLYAEMGRVVPFSFACLATTDPTSGVITWASKSRPLGVGDEAFAAAEYGEADVNRFEDLARRTPPVGALHLDTGGRPETCRRHRELMAPVFGFSDELRAVLLSRGVAWGALAVYRVEGEPPFGPADVRQLSGATETLARAIRRSLFRTDGRRPPPSEPGADGPAVLVVDPAGRATHLTPGARAAIEDLGGRDHGSLPATLLAVVARARSSGVAVTSRTRAPDGRWVSLRAVLLEGEEGAGRDVVVSAEPTPRAALSRLALRAHGLTDREEEVVLLVLDGLATREIAAALHLSPHTVQDHLKAVFGKVGVRSRRELTARLGSG